jgi:hypothetical protein
VQQTWDRGFGYKNSQTAKGSWSPGIRTQDTFQDLQLSIFSTEIGECKKFSFNAILFPSTEQTVKYVYIPHVRRKLLYAITSFLKSKKKKKHNTFDLLHHTLA